jgi:predicted transcriptional regulator
VPLSGHDWIIDVLEDLRTYAKSNGMTDLARKTDETLDVARQEIADKAQSGGQSGTGTGGPQGGQFH